MTILVVDDEALAAEEIAETLQTAGFAAEWCSDPFEALARGRDPRIRLVITDLRMPRLDGHELVERLRTARADLAVIVMSGHLDESAGASSAEPRIAKPISGDVLIANVRSVLS